MAGARNNVVSAPPQQHPLEWDHVMWGFGAVWGGANNNVVSQATPQLTTASTYHLMWGVGGGPPNRPSLERAHVSQSKKGLIRNFQALIAVHGVNTPACSVLLLFVFFLGGGANSQKHNNAYCTQRITTTSTLTGWVGRLGGRVERHLGRDAISNVTSIILWPCYDIKQKCGHK